LVGKNAVLICVKYAPPQNVKCKNTAHSVEWHPNFSLRSGTKA
jgi:hypothetical protein